MTTAQTYRNGVCAGVTPPGDLYNQFGDVVGPPSSVDNTLATWDGTTGQELKDGTTITAVGGALAGVQTLNGVLVPSGGFLADHWLTDDDFTLIPDNNYMQWGQAGDRVYVGYSTDALTVSAGVTGNATFLLPLARATPFTSATDCSGSVMLTAATTPVVGNILAVVGTTQTAQLNLYNTTVSPQSGALAGNFVYSLV